jgi:hypothetical protein
VDTCFSPSHGLQIRRANSGKYFDKHIKADLYQYFTDLEMLATPQATRVVCDIADTGLRDGEERLVELPPSFSKRSMYYRFIGNRGYDAKVSPRGEISAIKKTGESLACQPVCSWYKLCLFWKHEFPLLRLLVSNLFFKHL